MNLIHNYVIEKMPMLFWGELSIKTMETLNGLVLPESSEVLNQEVAAVLGCGYVQTLL